MQHEGCDDTAVLAAAVRNDDRVASGEKREDDRDGLVGLAFNTIGSNAPCGKREMVSMMVLNGPTPQRALDPLGWKKEMPTVLLDRRALGCR